MGRQLSKYALILIILSVTFIINGCSHEKPMGYTYDMTKKCQGIRLAEITGFTHVIEGDVISGSMKVGHKKTTFIGERKENTMGNDVFKGELHFSDVTYNFEINFSGLAGATGIYYNDARTLVNGFVIERTEEENK